MSELRYTVAMPPGVTGGKWTLTPQAQHPVGSLIVALPYSGDISAEGVLVSGGAAPDLPASVPGEDVASPDYLLELSYTRGGRQVPGVPVRLPMVETEPGIVDVAELLKGGRAIAVTPEQLANLRTAEEAALDAAGRVTAATLDLSGERERVEQGLADIAQSAAQAAATADLTVWTQGPHESITQPGTYLLRYTVAGLEGAENGQIWEVKADTGGALTRTRLEFAEAASRTVVNVIKTNGEVPSIADLRTRPRGDARAVRVLNYHAGYAGGGGTFVWDEAGVAADNGGTIIMPTDQAGPGRWRRLGPLGVHRIRDFGAVDLNQAPGYNSTPHIQAAVDGLNGPRDLAMMYNDADKSGGVVIADPGEFGLRVSDRASTFHEDGTRTYNAVIVDQSHVVLRAESPKASVWKALGTVGQYDKMVTFRRTSWGGFDRIKLDGQDIAKSGLDIDLCDYFYSDRLFVAFTRIAGLTGCNLWESYFGAPTFLLTGLYSTEAEPGGGILLTSRYRESPVHDAPDGACNNTVFAKPTFSVYGSFLRCEEPNTQNIMLMNPIAEIVGYPDRPATHEDKFVIEGQNTQIHGMYLNQHHTPVQGRGAVFNLRPDSLGTVIMGGQIMCTAEGDHAYSGVSAIIKNESKAGFGNVVQGLGVIDAQGKLPHVVRTLGANRQLRGDLFVTTAAGYADDRIVSADDVMGLGNTAVDVTVSAAGVVRRLNLAASLRASRVLIGPIGVPPALILPSDEVLHIALDGGPVLLDLNYYARWNRTVTLIATGGSAERALSIATNGVPIDGNAATYKIGSPAACLTLHYLPDGSGVRVVSKEVAPSPVPATATSTGVRGEWSEDGQYRYDCIADNTWRRVARVAW